MAKKHMYLRLDYESLWVNNHGACVEMDPDKMEQLVKTVLEDTCPLNDMKAKAQITIHKNTKIDKPKFLVDGDIPRNCG